MPPSADSFAHSSAGLVKSGWLAKLRKGDGRKVLVACLLRLRTAAGNPWIAKRLAMGHSGSVSRLVVAAVKHPPTVRELEKLGKLLKCDT